MPTGVGLASRAPPHPLGLTPIHNDRAEAPFHLDLGADPGEGRYLQEGTDAGRVFRAYSAA
jgi:hypothetical protein